MLHEYNLISETHNELLNCHIEMRLHYKHIKVTYVLWGKKKHLKYSVNYFFYKYSDSLRCLMMKITLQYDTFFKNKILKNETTVSTLCYFTWNVYTLCKLLSEETITFNDFSWTYLWDFLYRKYKIHGLEAAYLIFT